MIYILGEHFGVLMDFSIFDPKNFLFGNFFWFFTPSKFPVICKTYHENMFFIEFLELIV